MQAEALEPGTYYLNPYVAKVSLIDCRSQRYNLDGHRLLRPATAFG